MDLPKPPQATSHAKLSASSAHRWVACPGSVQLSEGVPNVTTAYAAEGTFAHHILATCLEQPQYKPQYWLGHSETIDGQVVDCEQDMVDAVETALEIIRERVEPKDEVFIEQDFTPALKELHPDFGGSSDICILKRKKKRLLVYDYKHGAGVWVDAEDNKQLKYYALGALLTCNAPVETIEVGIIQPRYGDGDNPLQIWSFDAVDLLDFSADLIDAAKRAENLDAPLNPGEKQCKFCPAAAKCPELERTQNELMAAEFDIVSETNLDTTTLAKALELIPLVEQRISQLRELAYNEGIKGNPPPGWKIVEKRPRRHWRSEEEAKEVLDMFLGDEAYTEPKLKSPAQVEKVLKGDAKKMVADLAESVSSGYTLAPESDKRKPALLASPDDFETVETDS